MSQSQALAHAEDETEETRSPATVLMGVSPPHREPAEAVVSALGSDIAHGLSRAEAQRRLEQYGPNRLEERTGNALVAAAGRAVPKLPDHHSAGRHVISMAEWLLQDPRETALPYEAIAILAIVVLNAMLGFVQEARAEQSVRALMALAAPEATVVRDGERQRVAADEIVPGDIVLVEAGDRIPADARIVEEANLQTDEAPLTGESMPVAKDAQPIDARRRHRRPSQHAVLGHRRHLWPGRGRGGRNRHGDRGRPHRRPARSRREGADAAPAGTRPHRQAAERHHAGICAVVFAAGLLSASALTLNVILGLFLFAVALAVAAIPEALPAIVTVGLSLGVRRMAAANAIVRKLPAVETLGAATVICSDKTGTLTRNEMTVRAIFAAGTLVDVGGSGYVPEGDLPSTACRSTETSPVRACRRTLTLAAAALANDAALINSEGRWTRAGRSDRRGADRRCAQVRHRPKSELARFPRIAEIPFTSERKRHTTVHLDRENPDELHVFVKGAPEILLAKCRYLLEDGKARAARRRPPCGALAAQRGARKPGASYAGHRHPHRAGRPHWASIRRQPLAGTSNIELPESVEDDLVLLGLVGMIDPPRAEAKAAVATAKQAHIRTVMITGDHPATAEAIARELDIFEPGSRLVTGTELRTMGDTELDAIVEEVRVFARVDPEHKLRIVGALQRKGHIVAMTGDGINDAPALKTANIGVAMGITGTDVSKEAADMVLTDDNFASIVKAIEEGRGIYDNIHKYLIYLLSSNAGELLTMFAGVMFAGALGLVSAEPGCSCRCSPRSCCGST